MSVEDDIDELSSDLALLYAQLSNPHVPKTQLGSICSRLSLQFRALAIIVLLGDGSTDWFLHMLMRSGRARLTYLERHQALDIADVYYTAPGRYEALLDAIAAADYDVARKIGALSAITLCPGEYEDDHHYGRILHALIAYPIPSDLLTDQVNRLTLYLDGEASIRLDLVRALINIDQDLFEEAFEELLVEFEDHVTFLEAQGQLDEAPSTAMRLVCMEALAILKLAEFRGLTTDTEYRFCPSLARRPMRIAFEP